MKKNLEELKRSEGKLSRCVSRGGAISNNSSLLDQKQYAPYFLARTELYMSKIIAGQVKEGMSSRAHEVMLDTYILSIGKDDIFKKGDAIKDDVHYEKTVVPMIKELNIEMPSNKMHWKFYELEIFQRVCDNEGKSINKDSPIKDQWLNFMLHCHEKTSVPEDVDEIIQKAYEIMKTANWPEVERLDMKWKSMKRMYNSNDWRM
jgi:hypothetical protein